MLSPNLPESPDDEPPFKERRRLARQQYNHIEYMMHISARSNTLLKHKIFFRILKLWTIFKSSL